MLRLLLTPLLLLLACSVEQDRAPGSPPHNLVLITADTLRADRLSPYGYEIATPALQRLADEGLLFEAAFSDAPWTLPAMSSVMTGRYPTYHGVRTWYDRLTEAIDTLPEELRAAGYYTAAIVGSFPLDRRFGLSQGFDYYDDEMTTAVMAEPSLQPTDESLFESDVDQWMEERSQSNAYRPDAEVAARAVEWLDANPREPFFLWLHFFGPHEKSKRPEGFGYPGWIDTQLALYDDAVEELDSALAQVLDRLRADPRFPDTAVLFHADHGQSLMERGSFGHGPEVFDDVVRIPLILRLPGAERGGDRVRELARGLDIHPTLLGLAGVSTAAGDGRSLLAPREAEAHAYFETHHLVEVLAKPVRVLGEARRIGPIRRGVRTEDWKLIVSQPTPSLADPSKGPLPPEYVRRTAFTELYQLSRDPLERDNRAEAEPEKVNELRRLLDEHEDERDVPRQRATLGDTVREQLRAIGYLLD